ncbi:MAG: hypothetical protein GY757_40375, partial [bacterium]|nr:hypothetical protein [bacterium]
TKNSNEKIKDVWAIQKDKSGKLWIGTDKGLKYFDKKNNRFKNDSNNSGSWPRNNVNTIFVDLVGVMWVGTNTGLFQYDDNKNEFQFFEIRKNSPGERGKVRIKVLAEADSNTLFVGTEEGLYTFDRNRTQGKFAPQWDVGRNNAELLKENIAVLFKDKSGKLWVGTHGQGVYTIKTTAAGEKQLTHYSHFSGSSDQLSHNAVRSIYEDKTGIIWIGTNGGAINKYDPDKIKFQLFRKGLPNSDGLTGTDITAICKSGNGTVWLGTRGNGLCRFNPENETFKDKKIMPKASNRTNYDEVRAVHEDRNGILWVGTDGAGLFKTENHVDEGTLKWEKINILEKERKYVTTIYEDKDGSIWIGGIDEGLIKLNRDGTV